MRIDSTKEDGGGVEGGATVVGLALAREMQVTHTCIVGPRDQKRKEERERDWETLIIPMSGASPVFGS
jgi:short-subunit dehydrogenase involved in D-alanine esterification of teichoic acids